MFIGVNSLGVIRFPFWATETLMLSYHVPERHVPPEHWASFRQPLRDLLAWLATPPRDRDNDRRFSLTI